MSEQKRAENIVTQMLSNDPFSRWLGIELKSVAPGAVVLTMTVRAEMMNGFGTGHGGVTFSLADSALAFACNSRGTVTVLLNASMSYPASVKTGDVLIASASEAHSSRKTGIYMINVSRDSGETVGIMKATVFRTDRKHQVEM